MKNYKNNYIMNYFDHTMQKVPMSDLNTLNFPLNKDFSYNYTD